MSKTSNVVWSLVGLVLAIVFVLGLIYGPGLYRGGKALVEPIVNIAQAENSLAELNAELPFTPPDEVEVAADRFQVFLGVRRALLPRYQEWQDMERALKKDNQEDWNAAMEVLAAVEEVMKLQVDTLRSHGMSPAEFIWIEDLAYLTWLPYAEEAVRGGAEVEALRNAASEDLGVLEELERAHGSSAATRAFGDHLRARLDGLGADPAPVVEGVPPEAGELFWSHRDELEELDLDSYTELHSYIRGADNVEIKIDGD